MNIQAIMAATMNIESGQLLLLLYWMSPAFPTGSFAYSHGLEQEIATGRVKTAAEAQEWIRDIIVHGSGWNDAVIFAQCWHDNAESLNELALALAISRERWLETTQLGGAFREAASVFFPLSSGGDVVAYPVAAGLACRAAGIDRRIALPAFLQGFANVLISVAVRLVPLGQTQGLEIMRDLMPVIADIAEHAVDASLDDLGSRAIASDIAAMRHETLHSRVFRT